jgi:LPS sulfotransferase NodH
VPLSARWSAGDDLWAYVRALRARRTSPSGVLGVKIHSDQLEHLARELRHVQGRPLEEPDAAELLPRVFPDATYVHIAREDVDRQAVSLWTALETGIWAERVGSTPSAPGNVAYSFEGINDCRELILQGERLWATLFARHSIRPLTVLYEQLVSEWAPTISRVLRGIFGDRTEAVRIAPPDSRRQSSCHSEELLARFTRDRLATGTDAPFTLSEDAGADRTV